MASFYYMHGMFVCHIVWGKSPKQKLLWTPFDVPQSHFLKGGRKIDISPRRGHVCSGQTTPCLRGPFVPRLRCRSRPMRTAPLLVLSALAQASAFAALPLPRTSSRALAPVALAVRSSPLIAAEAVASERKWWHPRAALEALIAAVKPPADLNLSGLEYVGFALLYGWGLVCVGINTFLWIFRYALEKSGLAPSSWYNKPSSA